LIYFPGGVKSKFHKGFTLAEVLLIIIILGVIACETIPTLIKDYQNKVLVVQAKKAFSTFSQMSQKMLADNGGTLAGNCFIGGYNVAFNCMKPYLSVAKECGAGTGCFYNDGSGTGYTNLGGGDTYYNNMDSLVTSNPPE